MTKRLTGTARYASINALKGGEQSRKDDLESLAYMLLYFLKGSLPWQGVAGMTKGEKYKKIYYMKKNIEPEELFKNLPAEFKEFYLYVKNLEFEQDPDYNYCRKLFINVIEQKCGDLYDNFFTWCKEINIINKNYFCTNNYLNNVNYINDESGKTLKSTKIFNICNSNILLEKINNKKIRKISVTFIDTKDKYMNCDYNYTLDKKRNKSLILDNICDINNNSDDNKISKKNKEIIVSNSSNNNSNQDYSIEGEIENNNKNIKPCKKIEQNKKKNNILNYKNKINILSLTKINKKNENPFSHTNNKFNKNFIKVKDLFTFSKNNNNNYAINNQLGQRHSRNKYSKNKSRDSKSKSSKRIKQKKITTCISNYLFKDIVNNSPGKYLKTKKKLISIFNTHTNILNKKKSKIKHSIKIQNQNQIEKTNNKRTILLEDFIINKNNNLKNQCKTSRINNNIHKYIKKLNEYKYGYSNIYSYPRKSRNSNKKEKYSISINDKEIKERENKKYKNFPKSSNTSKSKSKSKSQNRNKKKENNISSLSRRNSKCRSISNKQLKIQKIFQEKRNKRDIIININKCYLKRKKSNNLQKSDTYLNRIFNNKNNKINNISESRNNTINIESIVFVGDNNNNNNTNQYSLKSFNNKNKNVIYTPKNYCSKNNNKNAKNNFLKKFKISILCSNKKNKNNTNNNSIKKSNISKTKKKRGDNYNNISLKFTENKNVLKNKKKNKNVIYNYNNKKGGPLSFGNLINNIRGKKNININNNYFCNNSLIEKKYFFQSSFNSSDSNYILNNINNNNIIINNFNSNNNSTSQISKKMLNSYTLNHHNFLSDEINENSSCNNNNIGGLSNNNNSIFKDFIIKNNKNANKKENNSRQNIMKFIKKYQKNNVIKDNIQKTKNKKNNF